MGCSNWTGYYQVSLAARHLSYNNNNIKKKFREIGFTKIMTMVFDEIFGLDFLKFSGQSISYNNIVNFIDFFVGQTCSM